MVSGIRSRLHAGCTHHLFDLWIQEVSPKQFLPKMLIFVSFNIFPGAIDHFGVFLYVLSQCLIERLPLFSPLT